MTPNPMPGPTSGALPPKSAAEQLNVPSILLAISGALGVLYFLYSLVQAAFFNAADLTSALDNLPDPNMRKMMEPLLRMSTGPVRFVWPVVALGANGAIIFGALQMRAVKNWPVAMIAAVLATIPCCFSSCCCVIAMPAGIWSLTILLKDDIKRQFT